MRSLNRIGRWGTLCAIFLMMGCGQEFPEPDPAATTPTDPSQVVFIDVTGTGESGFHGRVEADLTKVFASDPPPPYVVCLKGEKALNITIAQTEPGVPYLDVLTITGLNSQAIGTLGRYTTDGFTGKSTKNGQAAGVSAYVSERAILYLAGKVGTSFMAAPATCTINVETRTGDFSCAYQEGSLVRETVTGTWACHGALQ